jgi:hypothetical protein
MAGEEAPKSDKVQFRNREFKQRVVREADRRDMSQSDVAEDVFQLGLEARDRDQNPEEMETKIGLLEKRVEEHKREVEGLREDKQQLRRRLDELKQELQETDPDARSPGILWKALGSALVLIGAVTLIGGIVATEAGTSVPDLVALGAFFVLIVGGVSVAIGFIVQALPARWHGRLPLAGR